MRSTFSVPVVMLSPFIVVEPLDDRSAKVTNPDRTIFPLEMTVPSAIRLIVELESPFETESDIPLTV